MLANWTLAKRPTFLHGVENKILLVYILHHQINESHHDAFCSEFPKRDQPGAKQNYRNNFSREKNREPPQFIAEHM